MQAAKNNLNSKVVEMCDNRWRVKSFFKEISSVLDLQLSDILRSISTQEQLWDLDERELPYLRKENLTISLLEGMST